MDAMLSAASTVFTVMARYNERLIQLAGKISKLPEVGKLTDEFEFRDYRTGPRLEAYIDAELTDGVALTWWLDLDWSSEAWIINASIILTTDQGRDPLMEYPEKEVSSAFELEAELDQIFSWFEANSDTKMDRTIRQDYPGSSKPVSITLSSEK